VATDRFAPAQSIADAVLYEGYVLYPYRASSAKNQVRWQFGVLVPAAYAGRDPSERGSARTECLALVGADAAVSVRVRFLQRQRRTVEAVTGGPGEPVRCEPTDRLEVDGQVHVAWDEAIDRVVDVGPAPLASLERGHDTTRRFAFGGGADTESLGWGDGPALSAGRATGRLVRQRRSVEGRITLAAARVPGVDGAVRLSVTVDNTTEGDTAGDRDGALGQSLLALHVMVAVDGGRFVSLLDPPEGAEAAAAACTSDGLYPVLVGDDDVVLAAPIILYDHPAVAPESPGDLYDATEIDEILALRVLTMTEEEKREARGTDPRAAAIVDRCDGMEPEAWDRLHGTFRPVDDIVAPPDRPEATTTGAGEHAGVEWWDPEADAAVDPFSDSVVVQGVVVTRGAQVILHPSRRSDAQDLFYRGQRATVAGVFRDVDGTMQVGVTIDDDPAMDDFIWQGRYLFFHPDEVEPLSGDAEAAR
jgi:hypothetical protein